MLRCMGCMAQYPDTEQVCPHCGYLRGTPPREAYHLEPESILNGRYIVGRVLGFGGFGVTYMGYDAALERVVAIKEFLPTTFATRYPGSTLVTVYEGNAAGQFTFGLTRFLEEAERLAQFNGIPGITDIYDTFTQNNTAYIVMEFLKGVDVKHLLSQQGPLPYEQAREIILSVCDTLTPVHAQNIIHRDISPDNIYLTEDGRIKLLDFGAARYESSVNSKSLSVILKAGYAPEEQYRSRGVQGPWTDVYALAATFYKLLTGQTPPDSMERAVRDELKEPSKLGVPLPESGENALMNALNLRQQERTQSVEAFAAALRSDGVERIKPKKQLSRAGRGMIVAAVALVVVGALMAAILMNSGSDQVVMVDPTTMEDTFGDALLQGNGLVPNISGKPLSEAESLLGAAGLSATTSFLVNPDVAPGTVIAQATAAGKQLAAGEAVALTVSWGSFEEAVESGNLKDLSTMDSLAAVGYLYNLPSHQPFFSNYTFSTHFQYSDTVSDGQVIKVEHTPQNRTIDLFLSAGPDNGAPPFGSVRTPLIVPFGTVELRVPVASIPLTRAPYLYASTFQFEYSVEGGPWQELVNNYYLNIDTATEPIVPYSAVLLERELLENPEQFLGKTLHFRTSQIDTPNEFGGVEGFPIIAGFDFTQTLSCIEKENTLTVSSTRVLSWSEVKALIEEGATSSESSLYKMLSGKREPDPWYIPYTIQGSFTKGTTYLLSCQLFEGIARAEILCTTDGVLYGYWNWGQGATEVLEVQIIDLPQRSISEDGKQLSLTFSKPLVITMQQ